MINENFKCYQIQYELKTNTGHLEVFNCNIISTSDTNVKNYINNLFGINKVHYLKIMNTIPIHSITNEVVKTIGLHTFNQLQTEFKTGQSFDTPKTQINDLNLELPEETQEYTIKRGLR